MEERKKERKKTNNSCGGVLLKRGEGEWEASLVVRILLIESIS
jgi:hypothetical protein